MLEVPKIANRNQFKQYLHKLDLNCHKNLLEKPKKITQKRSHNNQAAILCDYDIFKFNQSKNMSLKTPSRHHLEISHNYAYNHM